MYLYRCTTMLSGLMVVLATGLVASEPGQDTNRYRLTTVDGTILESSRISIDSAGEISGTFEGETRPIDEMVSIETIQSQSTTPRATAGSPTLVFATGGSISSTSPAIVDGQLGFQSTSGITSAPLESVRAIVWEPSDVVNQLIENASVDNDAVVVRQADQLRGVEGVVEGLTEQHVTLRFKGKSRKIGMSKVTAIVMADLQLELAADRVVVKLTLSDGGSIEGQLDRWQEDQIFVRVGADINVAVPAASLAKLSIANERLVYLSDLDPVSAQHRAMFTLERPWRRDQSVEANPLTLFDPVKRRKITYDKGIGTHSWSSLVFANDRSLDRFMATVGIDSETNGRGACRLIVRGDGIELWSGLVSGASGAQDIDVTISGIQEVELEVVPGEDFDLADHANWCNARFVKSNP